MSKILIVGGVAGGASTATRLRRLDENAEIILFEKGQHVSFANCGLPYYIGEVIKERDKLIVQSPKSINDRFNIDVRINSNVVEVDTKEKKVKVISEEKGTYYEGYDYLVLAPGAKPVVPNIDGINNDKIFTIRNVKDIDKVKNYIGNNSVKKAIVIGGGFVGIEMVENLRNIDIDVTLIEGGKHILAPFDDDMVTLIEKNLKENQVNLILNNSVKGFREEDKNIIVKTSDEKEIKGDMVILAIGVKPDTEFLNNSNIILGEKGHILVDKNMKTNLHNVYALGDAVIVKDIVSKDKVAIPLAGPANRQGRIVANNIVNISKENTIYKGTMGTTIIKVFDLVGACTGNNEKTLKNKNIDYNVLYCHPMNHATYYPGATQLHIKVLYDNNGKLLGAQALGYEGVDKFIDVIATVIKFEGTVYDLEELELAYAPPFLSAKSPANMVGFIAENNLSNLSKTITWNEVNEYDKDKIILLDVREKSEVENGTIEGSINIPLNSLRNNLDKLNKDKEIIVYCAVGLRGHIAARILNQNGYKVKNITGGYITYKISENKLKVFNNKCENKEKSEKRKVLDISAMCCSVQFNEVKNYMETLQCGETLEVIASNLNFIEDVTNWVKNNKSEIISINKNKGIVNILIKKGK